MARINQSAWKALTVREKEILKSIGIYPNRRYKTTLKKIWHVKPPKPYTLLITTRCELCGSSPRQCFEMVIKDDSTTLQAVPLTGKIPFGVPIKQKEIYSSTCSECPKELMKWEKADLIKKLLKVFPIASVGGFKR